MIIAQTSQARPVVKAAITDYQMVQEVAKEVAKNIPEQGSDPLLIAMGMVGIAAYMVKNLVMPMMDKKNKNGEKKDPEIANAAHKEILRSDENNIPYIRSTQTTPRLISEFKEEVKGLKEAMQKLANHNTDLLNDLHEKLLKEKK